MNNSIKEVIANGYCVGCGACASLKNSIYKMDFDSSGKYIPIKQQDLNDDFASTVCPFSNVSKNENEIGNSLFKLEKDVNHSNYLGYYIKSYAGHVKSGSYRENGSSGGMGTWMVDKLIASQLVDKVIHVKQSVKGNGILFTYQISSVSKELKEGAKSKYYPIEMSEVIKYVRENPGKYAFVGIPCFIKAVRLLAEQDPIISDRIKYTIGLVCGHLKTDRFAKSMAWQMGIEPSTLASIDFRVKVEGENASRYGVEAIGVSNNQTQTKQALTDQLFTTNWGHGFFKLKACDYCDDVLAETADITIGDAWLPEYIKDSMGTNVIIVRNNEILNILEKYNGELNLNEINEEKVYQSQSGGFRHRREGLSYRLFLKDQEKTWRPVKRVKPSNDIDNKRKKIYEQRVSLRKESDVAYEKALSTNSFDTFITHMKPLIKDYKKLNGNLKMDIIRILSKIKRGLLK